MAITLNIVNNLELDDEDLYNLTDDLRQMIDDETDISPQLVISERQQKTRSMDVVTLGVITLTFFSSGTAVALCDVLKAHFNREPSLELVFKDETGLEVKVNAKNIELTEIEQLLEKLRKERE